MKLEFEDSSKILPLDNMRAKSDHSDLSKMLPLDKTKFKSDIETLKKNMIITPCSHGPYIGYGIQAFLNSHKFEGYAALDNTGLPILFAHQQEGKIKPKADALNFFFYGWSLPGGSAFTITIFIGKTCPVRVYLHINHPVLEAILRRKEMVVLLFLQGKISGAYHLKLDHPEVIRVVKSQYDVIKSNTPLLNYKETTFWDTIQLDEYKSKFTRKDLLMDSWKTAFLVSVLDTNRRLDKFRNDLKEQEIIIPDILDPIYHEFGKIALSTSFSIDKCYDFLDGIFDKIDNNSNFIQNLIDAAISSTPFKEQGLPVCLFLLFTRYLLSPKITKGGTQIASFNYHTGEIAFCTIDVDNAPDDKAILEYWSVYGSFFADMLILNATLFLKGTDFPENPKVLNEELAKIKIQATDEELIICWKNLLTEAFMYKKWTIPWGALVQLDLGPFKYAEFYEFENDIFVLLRKDDWKYFLLGIPNSDNDSWNHQLPVFDDALRPLITNSLNMIIAAIIRDFYVVEERERVFKTERKIVHRKNLQENHPIIVYLPRVRYVGEADTKQLQEEMDYQTRRAHFVSAHLRVAAHSSERQHQLAIRYGFTLKEGYTFVKPHERGHKKREVIYRSRSALQSLFEAEIDDKSGAIPEWFKFERDVAHIMQFLGFEVDHIAKSRNGDGGVDLYAYKQAAESEEHWVIQCKCYGKKKIDPSIVREMIGAVSKYDGSVKAMIVTTGEFTKGANALAVDFGIRLMAGDEFLELLNKAGSRVTS